MDYVSRQVAPQRGAGGPPALDCWMQASRLHYGTLPMIASRTPEGEANRCPVCGAAFYLEPSRPPGDAPCPQCGCLVWFAEAPRPANDAAHKAKAVEEVKAHIRAFVRQIASSARGDLPSKVLSGEL